jgi:hypothetical protein
MSHSIFLINNQCAHIFYKIGPIEKPGVHLFLPVAPHKNNVVDIVKRTTKHTTLGLFFISSMGRDFQFPFASMALFMLQYF